MSSDIDAIKEKVAAILSGAKRSVSSSELQRMLGIKEGLLAKALFSLCREGRVSRLYTEEFDPLRPFDTAHWMIAREEPRSQDIIPVLSIPEDLGGLRAQLISKYSAFDLFDAYSQVINTADSELKIACPVIDGFGLRPIVDRIRRTRELKVRVITELDKSRSLVSLPYTESGRLRVKNALVLKRRINGTLGKLRGVHLKMAIADESAALVGSFNFSESHFLRNFDIGFLILSKSLVKLLSGIFDEIWRSIDAA